MMTHWIDSNERLPGWKVERIWAADEDGTVVAFERSKYEHEWISIETDDGGEPWTIQPDEFVYWMPYEPPPPPVSNKERRDALDELLSGKFADVPEPERPR